MNVGYERRLGSAIARTRWMLWTRYPHHRGRWTEWCDATTNAVVKRHKRDLAIELVGGMAVVALGLGVLHRYTPGGIALWAAVPFAAGVPTAFMDVIPKKLFTAVSVALLTIFAVSSVVYLVRPFGAASGIAAAYCAWIMFFLPPGFVRLAAAKRVRADILVWSRRDCPSGSPCPDAHLPR